MQELLTLLSQPIVQLGGVMAFLVALQKMGVDVVGMMRGAFGTKSIDFDNRTAMQELLNAMQGLTAHFNHETTSELTDIKDTLKELSRQTGEGNEILRAIDKYGIKCRKD